MNTEDPTSSTPERPVMPGLCVRLPNGHEVHAFQAPDDSFLFEFRNEGRTKRMRLSFYAVTAMFQLAVELTEPRVSA